jgi:hypothetical protein
MFHSPKWPEYPFLFVFIITFKQTKDISQNHHKYHRILTYIIHTTYLTKTINLINITTSNKFRHKHKSPTLTNISLKYLTKYNNNNNNNNKYKIMCTKYLSEVGGWTCSAMCWAIHEGCLTSGLHV